MHIVTNKTCDILDNELILSKNNKNQYTLSSCCMQLKQDFIVKDINNLGYYIDEYNNISGNIINNEVIYCPRRLCNDNKCIAYKNRNKLCHLHIKLYTNCNFKCKFCFVNNRLNFDTEEYKNILKQIPSYVNSLSIDGIGEITLILSSDILQYIPETVKHLYLYTNGYIYCGNILNNKLAALRLSIKGLNNDDYLKNTGIYNGFDIVYNNIIRYIDNGFEIQVEYVFNGNIDELNDVIALCNELNISLITLINRNNNLNVIHNLQQQLDNMNMTNVCIF